MSKCLTTGLECIYCNAGACDHRETKNGYEAINWKQLCEEKDQRIKELEGKFGEIVEKLEEEYSNLFEARMKLSEKMYTDKTAFDRARILQNKGMSILEAINIVKGVINE